MKQKKRYLKIRTKLFLWLLVMQVPILAVLDYGVYRTYREDVEQQVALLAEELNEHMSRELRLAVKSLEENMVYKIMDCDVFSYQDHLAEASVYEIERKMTSLSVLLETLRVNVESIYLLDKWNTSFFIDDRHVLHGGYKTFRGSQAWKYIHEQREEIRAKRGKTFWRFFEDTPDDIYLIKNVLDLNTLEYRGILCVQIDSSYLAENIGSDSVETVLYDETGQLLYSNDWIREDAIRFGNGEDLETKYLIRQDKVSRKRWSIVSFTQKGKILTRLTGFLRHIVLLEIVLGLIALLIVLYISGNITHNIDALVTAFRQIRPSGGIPYVQYRSNDETAYLCEKFNEMNVRLQHSIEQMTENSIQREKAEYNALMAQMNPHFLYNSLESIASMARLRGQPEISECVGKLSRLLRVSITTDSQEINLEMELDYIERYLELQRMITGSRLNWEIIREDGVSGCLVPKLILQPIVENSVIHGVADIPKDAFIIILTRRTEDGLIIEISDNGKGIAPEVLNHLLDEESRKDTEKEDRVHIGIRSIQKRIQILYGAEYGLDIHSSEEGTVTAIRLPLRTGETS